MSEGFSRSSNGSSSAIATLPNALSVARILLTPAFVWLRDVAILIAGVTLLVTRKVRIEVRVVGKVATFSLVVAIGLIAWGNLGYPFPTAARTVGWGTYAVGIVEYYVATALYAGDLRLSSGMIV